MKVLVLNCGSSSVKFELIETSVEAIAAESERKLGRGLIDKIGMPSSSVKFSAPGREPFFEMRAVPDHSTAIGQVLRLLTDLDHGIIENPEQIDAVGHRVLHCGEHFSHSVLLDEKVAKIIRDCFELGPLHNPPNLKGYELMRDALPGVPHVAVFDTSFHLTMPDYAYLYALPYDLYQKYKVRRYGFHGTSHRFMTYALEKYYAKRSRHDFNAITVHLGNGCSITAVRGGHSVDTSMGFTPLEGLVMGTRSGDLDPAVVLYLMGKEELSLGEMNALLNKRSGLAGLSGFSNDVRELTEAMKQGNERATLALKAFCYRARKYIGAYYATLGKVDYIALAGGIGENSSLIRGMILEGLENLGIEIDYERNHNVPNGGGVISTPSSKVTVCVIPTDEELVIARDTVRVIEQVKLNQSSVL